MNSSRHALSALLLGGLLLPNAPAHAGSATWNLAPTNGDWNTAANWSPATVPNDPADTATFDISQTTGITVLPTVNLNGMVFNSGASAYTISLTGSFNISGTGIVNNSGVTQNITVDVASDGNFGIINFTHNATSGESMNYDIKGGLFSDFSGADVTFFDNSSAGSGVFTTNGGLRSGATGAGISFTDGSAAAHATFIINGGGAAGATGSVVSFGSASSLAESSVVVNGGPTSSFGTGLFFYHTSVSLLDVTVTTNGGLGADWGGGRSSLGGRGAQGCIFTSNGGAASNAAGGTNEFSGTFDTGDSVLITNGGTNGGLGGVLQLLDSSVVGGRVELFGNGMLDLSQHDAPGAAVGSLEGDGIVIMGGLNLTVGSNSISTNFSGTLEGDAGSSLTKIGTGALTLSGANTYTGSTTVSAGALRISNTSGSGTGTGEVKVGTATLGGGGVIAGMVRVGTGSGTGAFLAPGVGASRLTTLTIQSALTFKADGTYTCRLNTKKTGSDQVVANGVTIQSGAQFNFKVTGNQELRVGKSATVINNTSATPIVGTFDNLPDGSTFTVGKNTFQANYEGGDGNDLTLTVVP
jgi:autotransporter-associated beta strand protein